MKNKFIIILLAIIIISCNKENSSSEVFKNMVVNQSEEAKRNAQKIHLV